MTSIKNQKNCGSCVAFGVLATVEANARFQSKDSTLATDLSEAQLFLCYRYSEEIIVTQDGRLFMRMKTFKLKRL